MEYRPSVNAEAKWRSIMAIRVGINGFGRIGRLVHRVLARRVGEFEVVAINDLSPPAMMKHLFKYDSTHGPFPGDVTLEGDSLVVSGKATKLLSEKDPAALPWGKLGVDIVLESTGVFSDRPGLEKHLTAGAPKVVLSAPAKSADSVDATIVLGVNDKNLRPDMKIISNASCTTNCLAPMAKILHERWGIVSGLMTTVHSFTNDQRVLDLVHSDPRRARGASQNIIPTSTGAAKAVGLVIPELKGKLTGIAMRVPTPTGSVTDLVANLAKPVKAEEINAAVQEAAAGPLKGILEYTTDPIVSSDIVGNPHSCIFDSEYTTVINDTMVKVIGWYDNEAGYSNRTADVLKLFASTK
jgi:glyceraldehyde 3-phosphate dehydrogenase